MSRTFTDQDLLVWEAFPSGGKHGFPENPKIVFNCLTNRLLRPRAVAHQGDEADAEALIVGASTDQLLALLRQARDID